MSKPDNGMRAILTIASELWPDGEIEIKVRNLATNEISLWTWDRERKKPIRRGSND